MNKLRFLENIPFGPEHLFGKLNLEQFFRQNEDDWKFLLSEDETSTEFYYLDENNQPITTSPR
jgi:hypothetical protein